MRKEIILDLLSLFICIVIKCCFMVICKQHCFYFVRRKCKRKMRYVIMNVLTHRIIIILRNRLKLAADFVYLNELLSMIRGY